MKNRRLIVLVAIAALMVCSCTTANYEKEINECEQKLALVNEQLDSIPKMELTHVEDVYLSITQELGKRTGRAHQARILNLSSQNKLIMELRDMDQLYLDGYVSLSPEKEKYFDLVYSKFLLMGRLEVLKRGA